jgi:hypothetical protein
VPALDAALLYGAHKFILEMYLAARRFHEQRQPVVLGTHCFHVQAKEHGILDKLKAVMHGDQGPLTERAEKSRIPLGVAVEMELI